MRTHPIEVGSLSAEYAVAIYGPVLFQIWERGTPIDGARDAVRLATKLAASAHPRPGTLVVVAEQSLMPSTEARRELSRIPEALARGAGLALAREGEGFRSAAVRAVLTGIMLLTRHTMPHEIFASVPAAATWLAERTGEISSLELVDVARELRERVRSER